MKVYCFMVSVIEDLEEQGRYSTAHVYRCAIMAALQFGGFELCLDAVTPVWLSAYQEHLLARNLLWNTISTYMRMLRALYNKAVDVGLAAHIPRHFKHVFTGRQRNHQRVLERLEMLRVLTGEMPEDTESPMKEVTVAEISTEKVAVTETSAKEVAVTETSAEKTSVAEIAAPGTAAEETSTEGGSASQTLSRRDIRWAKACLELMLRFHGLAFVDLAHLRKSDLRNGTLTLRRHKTGTQITIGVDEAAMKLIRRYADTDPSSPYLLDILDGKLSGREAYLDYQRALRMLNLRLGQIARRSGLGKRVSSYSARHTWANTAKACGVPVEVISEALGHVSIATTEGYLKQFGDNRIEKANEVIIDYIFGKRPSSRMK